MQMKTFRIRAIAFAAGIAFLACAGWASADPPSRVARIGFMAGPVSFSPAGESDWVQAIINRPMTSGDRLWADAGARAEIQVGGAMIRMNAGTGVSILNLDDSITQLQLTQGTLSIRVRHLDANQVFEVDTPNLAFTLRQPGAYRIGVDPDGNATTIVVRKGQGEAYGEDAAYVIDSRQPYRFTGTGLREYQQVDAPRLDDFDGWSNERDRSYDNSASARYVSQDVVGYEDLDANGAWRVDPGYGNVWIPNRVAAGWSPYHDGHWAWVDPWGWTWVDDAPWGFAVSHYGRWTNLGGTWGWVPGPVRSRAYYAPALVAFVGGSTFQVAISGGNVGGIAWFPLGPRDVYRPSYAVSRGYFENVNRSNTVINTTVINNYYNNTNVTNVVYANRQIPGAVVAVPAAAFVQSQPVGRAAVRVTPQMMASAPVAVAPSVAPSERSVRGAASPGDKPPSRVFERPVVARSAPPPAAVGLAAQQQQLAAKPGTPLDDAARRGLRPAAAAPAPVVKVIAQTQQAPPSVRPPPAPPGAKAGDDRGKSDERKAPVAPAIAGTPGGPTQITPPVPVTQTPEPRGKAEQRGPPGAPSPGVPPPQGVPPAQVAPRPQGAAPPPGAPPQVAPVPPATQSPDQRGKSDPRGQPVTPPPASPTVAVPPAASPSPAATPPSAQPPEQRGKGEQRGRPVTPPPAQRAEPKAVVPQPVVPATQPPPQRATPPNAAPPLQGNVPAPQPTQRPKPEPIPAAKPAEPRPPVAPPKAAPPPTQPQPAPKAEPRGQEPKPAAAKPVEKKKSVDELKRDEEERKQKGSPASK